MATKAEIEHFRGVERICSADLCDKKHYAHGWCAMHYQRMRNNGSISIKEYSEFCQVYGCGAKRKSIGLCVKHYTRMLRHGTLEATVIVADDAARLKANSTINNNGCWEWQKFKKLGYGVAYFDGKICQAHRASWEVFVGPITKGMQVNHKCHNRACINPEHLYVGTQVQNMADMEAAGRANKAYGERCGTAKLNADAVGDIRQSTLTSKQLAEKYSVSQSLIKAVKKRMVWKHV